MQDQIENFNQTIHTTNPTPANNPYQIYLDLYIVRWVAISDLLIFDYKGQTVRVPLIETSEQNCWYNTTTCQKLNDPDS